MGRLISNVPIESGLVDHLIHLNLMEDVTMDIGKPLNGRNLKSMGLIDKVIIKPTRSTSWEELKDKREKMDETYLFTKSDPPKVIEFYLKNLEAQGYDISNFNMDSLSDHPQNFLKRKREPSQSTNVQKKKILNLGESSATKKKPVPLTSSSTPYGNISILEALNSIVYDSR